MAQSPEPSAQSVVRKGQASLEMAVALLGMMLLLLAGVKVFVWINERVIGRQIAYESSRVTAGSATPTQVSDIWTDSVKDQRLQIFE